MSIVLEVVSGLKRSCLHLLLYLSKVLGYLLHCLQRWLGGHQALVFAEEEAVVLQSQVQQDLEEAGVLAGRKVAGWLAALLRFLFCES